MLRHPGQSMLIRHLSIINGGTFPEHYKLAMLRSGGEKVSGEERLCGQIDGEERAGSYFAGHFHPAAMGLNNGLDQAQTQTNRRQLGT